LQYLYLSDRNLLILGPKFLLVTIETSLNPFLSKNSSWYAKIGLPSIGKRHFGESLQKGDILRINYMVYFDSNPEANKNTLTRELVSSSLFEGLEVSEMLFFGLSIKI